MADFIARYGYLAVFFGCLVEGETTLVLGAIAAKLGFLDIGLVILVGIIGTFIGDNIFFFLGRWYGDKLIDRWPIWRAGFGGSHSHSRHKPPSRARWSRFPMAAFL